MNRHLCRKRTEKPATLTTFTALVYRRWAATTRVKRLRPNANGARRVNPTGRRRDVFPSVEMAGSAPESHVPGGPPGASRVTNPSPPCGAANGKGGAWGERARPRARGKRPHLRRVPRGTFPRPGRSPRGWKRQGVGRGAGGGGGGGVAGGGCASARTRERDGVTREVDATRNSGDCRNPSHDLPSLLQHSAKHLRYVIVYPCGGADVYLCDQLRRDCRSPWWSTTPHRKLFLVRGGGGVEGRGSRVPNRRVPSRSGPNRHVRSFTLPCPPPTPTTVPAQRTPHPQPVREWRGR